MRQRDAMRLYQTAARIWLTAAGLSLLLPAGVRLGWWVPLHLMLLGAVSVAISGAMQNFVAALTATGSAPRSVVWAQFGLTNAGAALIVAGRASGLPGLVAAGGTAFLAGILLLGGIVLRARRRALNVRHRIPVAMYGGAVACVLVGGAIGIVLGTGTVGDPQERLDLRSAHMVINVLGWVSFTIAGTLITLLPTVLRVRMSAWHGRMTAALFMFGVGMTATGLALDVTPLAVVGAATFAAGVVGLLVMVRRVLSTPRRWPVPVSAKHLLLALGWFAAGALWLLVALIRGARSFAGAQTFFVVVFAGGWILQTLLGAWQYLLPMTRPGHPDDRRASLAAMEWGGSVQLVALNIGLVLLALAASRSGASVLAAIGAAFALVGATMALIKSWTYPILGRSAVLTRRSRPIWDPVAGPGEPRSDVSDGKP